MSETIEETNCNRNGFICGVVEGFYGRPWTTEQRKDLFQKLSEWGMNTYVYAPKDDYKHRAYWREMYTVEEAEHLSSLISAAKEQNIEFCYALSPGLDIVYSNPLEVATLKRKLDQVSQFGCKCFALLFDDIEPEMSDADKKVFQSFAHAQVSVTNEIYEHLGCPKFHLCPTQYCASRAVPNVESSEYLNTLGTQLSPKINIMWTGSKVISKNITRECIEGITQVLKRKPLIWDNLHANDYDQKRIFLGPYCGRSPEIIPFLAGVLTNPNCEYNANHIGIFTLAHWSKCEKDVKVNDCWDVKLEKEGSKNIDDDINGLDKSTYHHRSALRTAIGDWLSEFSISKDAQGGPVTKPQTIINVPPATVIPIVPSVNTCMSLASTVMTEPIPTVSTSQLRAFAEVVCGTVATCSAPVTSTVVASESCTVSNPMMNSLVSPTKVVTNDQLPNPITTMATQNINIPTEIPVASLDAGMRDLKPNGESNAEMEECTSSPMAASLSADDEKCSNDNEAFDILMADHNTNEIGSMQVETSNSPLDADMIVEPQDDLEGVPTAAKEPIRSGVVCMSDLELLVDFMYLPFSHGNRGLKLLNDIHWLRQHCTHLRNNPTDVEANEWRNKCARVLRRLERIRLSIRRILCTPNRGLAQELTPYLQYLSRALSPINAYLMWLQLGKFPSSILTHYQGAYNWFSKGWREAFECGKQEPWVFRGGLAAEIRRLLPADCVSNIDDLNTVVTPYNSLHQEKLWRLCLNVCKDGSDASQLLEPELHSLPFDCFAGAFVELYPEFCFVFEMDKDYTEVQSGLVPAHVDFLTNVDTNNIVGFVCGAPNASEFKRKLEVAWRPHLKEKYATHQTGDNIFAKEYLEWIFRDGAADEGYGEENANSALGLIYVCTSETRGISTPLSVLFSALKSHGTYSVQTCVKLTHTKTQEMYTKVGFTEQSRDNNQIYFTRNF